MLRKRKGVKCHQRDLNPAPTPTAASQHAAILPPNHSTVLPRNRYDKIPARNRLVRISIRCC